MNANQDEQDVPWVSAVIHEDGSCEFRDQDGEESAQWVSLNAWALAWIDEWRGHRFGPACDFIHAACDEPISRVVEVLLALANATAGDEEVLGWVGAGPLEDLLSHNGCGFLVLDEVERVARREPLFRAAMGKVWLGSDVAPEVKVRLVPFGAADLDEPQGEGA